MLFKVLRHFQVLHLNLRSRLQWFLLLWNNADVKNCGKDEYEAGGRCGSCTLQYKKNKKSLFKYFELLHNLEITCHDTKCGALWSPEIIGKRTDEAKDVFHGGYKYNKQINQKHQGKCDAYVPGPVEGFVVEQNLKHSPSNLQSKGTERNKVTSKPSQI